MQEENKVHRALLIRLYPNNVQKELINKTLGSCRFLYNNMLAERIEIYEELKEDKRSLYEYKYKTEKQYKEEFDWMKEVSAVALQQSRMDLVTSYSNFFKSIKKTNNGGKVGFPKFHKKGRKDSYREVMSVVNSIDFDEHKIKLPKLGKVYFRRKNTKEWYKNAVIKNITITKKPSGKYYASVLFEGEKDFKGEQEYNKNSKIIGLDMSMDKFYVDNLGNSPDFKRLYRVNEHKIAKAQKDLSRTKKGSNNRDKARIKLNRLHEKIKNQRNDFAHKLSHNLVKNYDVIVVESLSLQGMSQALNLGKSVHDLGYSEFVRQLQYKCLWNDKTLIQADKWFASSKMCSFCGFKNKDLKLQERDWTCPNCGKKLNRDQNAGINLQQFGLEFLGLGQPEVKPVESNNVSNVNDWTMKQEAQGLNFV